MIDYGVKAPTEQIIVDNLVAAKLGIVEEGVFIPVLGVSYVYLGKIVKVEGDEETPPIFTEDVHADLRFDGLDKKKFETALKARTKVSLKADLEDGAPVTEGREDGFKIYLHSNLKSPSHKYWSDDV